MSNKRPRLSFDKPIVDVWERQLGQLSSRCFARRFAASEDLILRLDLLKKLKKHAGCVNTVSFNATGDILLSGSEDGKVVLCDWVTGSVKLSFDTGRVCDINHAKLMPFSDDRSIVTCGADGSVRHAQILDGGGAKTTLLGSHEGCAHKLAIEPGSPYIFYSCGTDGLVQHFDLRTKVNTKLFICRSIDDRRKIRPFNLLNAIAIDARNPNLFAAAGDDEYTRLYDIRKYTWDGSNDDDQPMNFFCPRHLIGEEDIGITGLAFSESSELLVSYSEDNIYLFTKDMGLGPSPVSPSMSSTCSDSCEQGGGNSSETCQGKLDTSDENPGPLVYKGHKNLDTLKGVSFFGPGCEYVVSGSDCGHIFIWKKKDGRLVRVLEADDYVVNYVEPHPHNTMLASIGIERSIKLWTPEAEEKVALPRSIRKRRTRGWMYHQRRGPPLRLLRQYISLHNGRSNRLLRQYLSLHNGRSNAEENLGTLVETRARLQLLINYSPRINNDGGDEGGGDGSGPEDYFD